MRVDQILCAAGPVDGVTGQALAYRRLLRGWGWRGEDYAPVQAAGMPDGAVRPLHQLRPARADILVVHYSGYTPGLEGLFAGARRSLLVSHNVTPAHYFWASDPAEAVRCQLGQAQLGELASLAGALAAVSEFNAAELRRLTDREVSVIPVLFDRRGLPDVRPHGASPPTVLFVGRLTPHKRQDLVIRAFARWRVGALSRRRRVPLSLRARGLLHSVARGLSLRASGHRPRRRRGRRGGRRGGGARRRRRRGGDRGRAAGDRRLRR